MIKFEDKYFVRFKFTEQQIERNLKNALKDIDIARKDNILEVKFSYAYSAFLKAGIALLSYYQLKAKSVSGHHVKIIEMLAKILKDETIEDIGNVMRSKRNLDLYSGGIIVTEKEADEYVKFAEEVLIKVKETIKQAIKKKNYPSFW